MALGQLSCLPSEVVTTKFSISPLTYLLKLYKPEDVSGASINYCVSSTCFKSAPGSSVVFAVRTFSISPLTYLEKSVYEPQQI